MVLHLLFQEYRPESGTLDPALFDTGSWTGIWVNTAAAGSFELSVPLGDLFFLLFLGLEVLAD